MAPARDAGEMGQKTTSGPSVQVTLPPPPPQSTHCLPKDKLAKLECIFSKTNEVKGGFSGNVGTGHPGAEYRTM